MKTRLQENSGDSIYTCNILDGLFDLSEYIDIVYFDSNVKEPIINQNDVKKFRTAQVVKFRKKNPLKFIFSFQPGMIVNRKSKDYSGFLKKILQKYQYDSIILNHQKMMFTLPVIIRNKKKARLIYTSHNVEFLLSANLVKYNPSLIKKIIYWQDAVKTKYFERKWISCFDEVTAISEHDAEYFQRVYKNEKVSVLRPVFEEIEKDIFQKEQYNKKINNLIIAGSFDWKPKKENLLLFLNAKNFDTLWGNGIFLNIVGRADSKLVDFVNGKYKGLHMTGEVPSLKPYYQKSQIAIIPERLGGGFKLKIVEGAIYKNAIFAIKGAITKCIFEKDKHFVEKNTFEELIHEILRFQNEPEELTYFVNNAFKTAKKNFTIGSIEDSLRKII